MSRRGDPGDIPWVGRKVLRVLKPVEGQDRCPTQVNFNRIIKKGVRLTRTP